MPQTTIRLGRYLWKPPRTLPVARANRSGHRARPEEIADGVHLLRTGRGILSSNVYFVRSRRSWVLIDAAWPKSEATIRAAAESVFGAGTRPSAIVLTHLHPDHEGSVLPLATGWQAPVYAHPREMPMAPGRYLPEFGNPLDRWLVVPILRLVPRGRLEAAQRKSSLEGVLRAFDPAADVPGLPGWSCVPSPGHTPGHTAFFRRTDKVLITGDAVLPIDLNSVAGPFRGDSGDRLYGPPYISSWDWSAAKESIGALARLEPDVLAAGHGRPMTTGTAAALHALAERYGVDP